MDELLTISESIPAEMIRKIDNLNKQAWEVHITQPKLGLELSSEAKTLSEENSYPKGLAYAVRNMGVSHRYLSNLETALSLSIQALDMLVKLGEKSGEAQAYVSIGAIYYYMGDYERSLNYFLKGLRLNEEIGNKEAQAYALNGAGYIYSTLGDNKNGVDFLQRALALSKDFSLSHDIRSRVLESMAFVYLNDGQLDKAYETYIECLRVSEKSSQSMEGQALYGIGDIFVRQNRLDEAKEYFLKSLTILKGTDREAEANSLLHLGKLFLRQEDSKQAKEYFLEALAVSEEIKAKAITYKAHEALAELFEKEEDTKSFVKHYKLYHKYKSEVFKDEQENKQKYLNIQNEMEKLQQETEINRLNNVVMKEKNEELEMKTEELEQSYNSISVLSKIGRDITSTLDLATILNTVYENVNQLMDASVFGIGVYNAEDSTIDYQLAIDKGKRYKPYSRSMEDKDQFPVWCIENKKEIFINNIEVEYSNYINSIVKLNVDDTQSENDTKSEIQYSLLYVPMQVKERIIGLITVQSYEKNAYTQHHLDILKTLASYTSAALYNAQSFETLQNTLNELKVTQQQLVQSEKMASLGELTAGIAHEIQNPLNFVNNFSEVSNELIDEMKEELQKGNQEDAFSIADDIKQNLEKINHHGKRADAIVKGMLQHSRSSSGVKEPTDINALCDEYLRLSYHGLRAKDKSFNATIETDFDKSIGNINIIPQDIGRVVLNLLTNAFYVVDEKKKSGIENYEPTVSISTKKINDKVEVKVKDNGNGIPEKVLDKIFQPFFTTKPTGQGTGLGLSLSYDIIKAHGGEIKVETKDGEARPDDLVGRGTEFIIQLPVV
ncbi:MAG TPA: tetratricopeptide repeat protein [Chitinophagaceae bacterium]|nr:tetratricopeptide repeat protein [Chitinophagaceae bacterium]